MTFWTQYKNKPWVRRAAVGAVGLALVWVAAWLAVPPLAKHFAQKMASETLGRTVTIGRIDFLPWTLELTVSDLAVAAAAADPVQTPQLQVGRLYIDGELQSLLRLAPVVDAVTVEAPRLRLAHRAAGQYDIDDILARLQPAPAAPPPSGDPLRFALYNLSLSGGAVDYTDGPKDKTHTLRDLSLSLPFLSNLASKRDVKVVPHLAFTLNGSAFDSAAEATPFAQTRKTDASFKLSGLDLAPYLRYLPAGLPVTLQAGVVDADLKLSFEQLPQAAVKLSGKVSASQAKVGDARGRDLLAFQSLALDLADVQPLARVVKLSAIRWESPQLTLHRDAQGQFDALAKPLVEVPKKGATAPTVAKAEEGSPPRKPASAPASAASGAKAPTPAATDWQLQVAEFTVQGGAVLWADDSTRPAARLPLTGLALQAKAIAWPLTQPASLTGSAALDKAMLSFSGSGTADAATATVSLGGWPLAQARPYLAAFLAPQLNGMLDADLQLQWAAQKLTLALPRLALTELALADGKTPLASVKKLEVTDSRIDLAGQAVNLGRVRLAQPRAAVARDAQGQWMYERWLQPAKVAKGEAPPAPASAPAKPWAVVLGELSVDGGLVNFQDNAGRKPVAFDVSALRLSLKNFSPDGKKPSPLAVSARIGAGPRSEAGLLDVKGSLVMAPLAVQATVLAQRLPLQAFEPYFGDALNIELLRADASFKGQVRYADAAAGPSVKLSGDVALDELRAIGAPPPGAASDKGLQQNEDILRWKTLAVRGLDLALAPGTATSVSVAETALSDFFARIVVNETGRINLQDLSRSAEVPAAPAAGASAPTVPVASAPASAASGGPAVASGPEPVIRVGPVTLVNGEVYFSDRFIKPNYSANLTELTGKLSAFSSQAPAPGEPLQLAELELKGRAEGTASLDITGKLNPLVKPLALDITGKVRDLELPPLSPYAVKYAGYGIERGKLSLDVTYAIQPNGLLTASNKFVLNQLSFGDKVEGAPNSLPVKLAVALLADRNGVIDINLPISGSLNDPQFSIGPIIFKLIVNLIVKAVTSPFSLLAGALGGGGDELGVVAFLPGSALLSTDARAGLDKVAKALSERQALKLTVAGAASLAAERDGVRRERLYQMLLAEKRRATPPAGGNPQTVNTVNATERPALLKAVYQRADFPKPRNLVGLAKDLPPAEMEALLLANTPVSEDTMRELALQRSLVVRDYLIGKQLPAERLFLGAARVVPADASFKPRADLALEMR